MAQFATVCIGIAAVVRVCGSLIEGLFLRLRDRVVVRVVIGPSVKDISGLGIYLEFDLFPGVVDNFNVIREFASEGTKFGFSATSCHHRQL